MTDFEKVNIFNWEISKIFKFLTLDQHANRLALVVSETADRGGGVGL